MIVFQEDRTSYHGRRERIAVVYVANQPHPLGLNDTRECAKSTEHCKRVLKNLGATAADVAQYAHGLHQYCLDLTGYKAGFWSKENPGGVKRDRPRFRSPRRFYL